jgi:hypothetical protein
MTRWLALLSVIGLAAAPSAAGAATFDQWGIAEPEQAGPKLKFRLVQEPVISSRPIHNSGMIAQTEVAPNAAIGIGLFKSTQRKPDAGEWRLDERSTGSRKAAVRFLFKF